MGSQRVRHDWATELNWSRVTTALTYSFSYLEPACYSMSSSKCCFLTCIQISQKAGQVVWYFHLFQNFLQFVVIHTVKGFGIVNKAEVYVFQELFCFFDDSTDVGNLIFGSSAFSTSSLNIWNFSVHVLLKPGLENFEHYFASMWVECNCAVVWAFFGIAFLPTISYIYLQLAKLQNLRSKLPRLLSLLTPTPSSKSSQNDSYIW